MLVVTVPPRLVALIVEPEVTPSGTVTSTLLAVKTVKGALTPPIAMFDEEAKLEPVKVKVEPTSLTSEAVRVMLGFSVFDVLEENDLVAVPVPPVLVTLK